MTFSFACDESKLKNILVKFEFVKAEHLVSPIDTPLPNKKASIFSILVEN